MIPKDQLVGRYTKDKTFGYWVRQQRVYAETGKLKDDRKVKLDQLLQEALAMEGSPRVLVPADLISTSQLQQYEYRYTKNQQSR